MFLRDGLKSLPLSSLAAPSTKEHHCSREKKHSVYTYVSVCARVRVWCDTEITQKSSAIEKRRATHTPRVWDEGIWRRVGEFKRLGEAQKDRLSIYKRDCTSNIAISPWLSDREPNTLEHNVSHLCKQISFPTACLLNQIQLRAPCLVSWCEWRQIYCIPLPYIYLLLWAWAGRFKKLSSGLTNYCFCLECVRRVWGDLWWHLPSV